MIQATTLIQNCFILISLPVWRWSVDRLLMADLIIDPRLFHRLVDGLSSSMKLLPDSWSCLYSHRITNIHWDEIVISKLLHILIARWYKKQVSRLLLCKTERERAFSAVWSAVFSISLPDADHQQAVLNQKDLPPPGSICLKTDSFWHTGDLNEMDYGLLRFSSRSIGKKSTLCF